MADVELTASERARYYRLALGMAVFTVVANLVEGGFSTVLGLRDETVALFGFGVDSFIEVISAVGIAHMVLRIRAHPDSSRGPFEVTALRVTGVAFYLLAAGLVAGAVLGVLEQARPRTTVWGIVISLLSISVMTFLVAAKRRVGKKLSSEPILADAACTTACIYMSVVLLLSSLVFELTHVGFLDAIGALGIAWFAFSEGREDFEKARGKACHCEDSCGDDDG